MGAAEALSALELFPELKGSTTHRELLENFQHHAGNLSLLQSESDGRWHNILDDPETFTETSSTAMILTAILRGTVDYFASFPSTKKYFFAPLLGKKRLF